MADDKEVKPFLAKGFCPMVRNNVLVLFQFDQSKEGETMTDLFAWATPQGFKGYNPTLAVINEVAQKSVKQNAWPDCPIHHVPMKESTKGGGYFCSNKTNGEFCKKRADKFGNIK